MWRAKYIWRGDPLAAPKGCLEYWRTVYGDDNSEADRLARRYCNKGYMLASVVKPGAGGY